MALKSFRPLTASLRFTTLNRRLEDVETLFELGQSEGDADALAEVQGELIDVSKSVGELEVRTLLSGEYEMCGRRQCHRDLTKKRHSR